jgi:membrane protease subunit HflK
MANGNKLPQNGKDDTGQPPDLEMLLRRMFANIKPLFTGGGAGPIIGIVLVALTVFGLWTTYYTVPSDSVAIVQRFGKYLKEVPPGLHFKLPIGIDTATIVP